MAVTDRFLQTVEAVHAAGLDPALWPDALAAVTDVLGGAAATLETFDRRDAQLLDFHSHGLPAAAEIAYMEEYAVLNPRIPLLLEGKTGDVVYDRLALNEQAMDRDPFYSDVLAPLGLRYFVGGNLAASKREKALFSVQRTVKQGHAEKAEIGLARRLMPHIRLAYDVAKRLRDARETRNALVSSLDWIAYGAGLLDAHGSLFYANAALQQIARECDGMRATNGGQLEFSRAAERVRFANAVAMACRLRDGDMSAAATTDFSVPRPSGKPPYLVSVRPLLRGGSGSGPVHATAILFVRDPSQQHLSTVALLREVFGFTPAEASLAQALQAGASPTGYAREHGLSFNTVYTHLRRIREKTGCNQRGQLVRKLTDILMLLRDS